MVRSASEFIIGPRFARTRWRVSNHEIAHSISSFETALTRLLSDEECVPRMLRSAISAFTRVFDTLCGALQIRGPSFPHLKCLGPGSAEQREERCTASGTREVLLHILSG
jgi:hypothetical protein